MKKLLYGIVSGILLIAICFGVVFFGFEKTIPTDWVNGQIEEIKASQLEDEIEVKVTPLKLSYTDATYTKDGDKTIITYDVKAERYFKNTTKNNEESYEIKCVDYKTDGSHDKTYLTKYYMEDEKYIRDTDGTKEEVSDFDEILMLYGIGFGAFYTDAGLLKTDIINMIENSLKNVTQKGMKITLHLEQDNIEVSISYNLIQKRICRFEQTTSIYDTDNILTNRTNIIVEF